VLTTRTAGTRLSLRSFCSGVPAWACATLRPRLPPCSCFTGMSKAETLTVRSVNAKQALKGSAWIHGLLYVAFFLVW